jgi:hypothetical protein
MKAEEAELIVSWLVGAYPEQAGNVETERFFRETFLTMDAREVAPIILSWVKTERRWPRLADIRQAITNQRRLAEAELWRQLPPERPPRPAWVERWSRAREAGDDRLFPEQAPGIRENHAAALESYGSMGRSGYEEMLAKLDVPFNDAEVWVQSHEYVR